MHFGGALYCIDYGHRWQYVNDIGNLFSTMHIIVIALQGIMCEKVFYHWPKHFNLIT